MPQVPAQAPAGYARRERNNALRAVRHARRVRRVPRIDEGLVDATFPRAVRGGLTAIWNRQIFDEDPTVKGYHVVCERHGTSIRARTLDDARPLSRHPQHWCRECHKVRLAMKL